MAAPADIYKATLTKEMTRPMPKRGLDAPSSTIHLTRVVTRAGDKGKTAIGDLSRTAKTDPRVEAIGAVDEANTFLGAAVALGGLPEPIVHVLRQVQNDLFDVGGDLATPVREDLPYRARRVEETYVTRLEAAVEEFNAGLEPLHSFVLPGGSPGAALLHQARAVTRRAERRVWAAIEEHGEGVNPVTVRFLNRLSDLLFVLSRAANQSAGVPEPIWLPGDHNRADLD